MALLRWGALTQLLGVLMLVSTAASTTHASTLPAGFSETLVAQGLSAPTAMQFAPDGRLFVCEQGGRLRVIKGGVLLPTPFLTLTVSSVGERGLLGVAFDPNFAANHFVYVYYTATTPTVHNRLSRFVANGDVAVAGSETILLELDNLSSATNHNGGALDFGPDGKLYAAVGDNANGANAQSLNNLLGKIVRINSDGTIPIDNPFVHLTTGRNRAIWALGLRNPFTFAFNPAGGEMFINDVGENTWEEINDGIPGANYGWPETEGPTSDARFKSPRYAYAHTGSACAITGGAFYVPAIQFPSGYERDYFFADYCAGSIRRLDPASGNATSDFAGGIPFPVDLKVADDGSLYYLARGTGGSTGVVYRVAWVGTAPTITTHPQSRSVSPGAAVTFSVRASGSGTLRFQWQRNGTNIVGATAQDYTIAAVTSSDNGVRFRAIVSNDFGSAISNEALLTVTANRAPTAAITQPTSGSLYSGGNLIAYAGTGTDPEDGTLPAAAFTWRVDFHHATHLHPFIPSTSGSRSGSFTIPVTGETSADVRYRIHLTVRDSAGLTHSTYVDILPRKVRLTLATGPAGLTLKLDEQPVATPISFDAVVGIIRTLEAVTPQASGGTTYSFSSWSDGGAARHTISTPATNTTYTATYSASGTGGTGTGLKATYFDNIDFTGTTLTRIDGTVNFTWLAGSPASTIAADTFSARWIGQVEAQFTETYRFYTQSDDGVRLWVNGQAIVSNWTDHSTTENTGAISLVAGRRYQIRLEFYEKTGYATMRLLWSSPSTPKAVVPSARLYPPAATAIRINFQPGSAPIPAGYLPDAGLAFGVRGNGQTYGWSADNTAQTRDRNAANSPDQRYDTLVYMQRLPTPDLVWEIAVPNGPYAVRVVAGDASYFGNTIAIAVETLSAVSGTTTSAQRWLEGRVTVTVSDGRLTIRNGPGAAGNKICFVEITQQ